MRYLVLLLVLCGCKVDNGHVPPAWEEPMPTSLPTIPEQPVTQLPQSSDYPSGAGDYAPEARRVPVTMITADWCVACPKAKRDVQADGRFEVRTVEYDERRHSWVDQLPTFVWSAGGRQWYVPYRGVEHLWREVQQSKRDAVE